MGRRTTLNKTKGQSMRMSAETIPHVRSRSNGWWKSPLFGGKTSFFPAILALYASLLLLDHLSPAKTLTTETWRPRITRLPTVLSPSLPLFWFHASFLTNRSNFLNVYLLNFLMIFLWFLLIFSTLLIQIHSCFNLSFSVFRVWFPTKALKPEIFSHI